MPDHGQDHFERADPADNLGRSHGRDYIAPASSQTDRELDEEDSTLVDGVAYLSLRASGATDVNPEPFYMGSSSGATIARLIQSAIFRRRRDPFWNRLGISKDNLLRRSTQAAPQGNGPTIL